MNNPVMLTDATGCSSFWENLWKVVVGVVIIAGLIAGTILTGGTLSVILAGASIGAVGGAIGATASSIVTGIVTGDWDNFGNSFLMGTVAGGISGAVGGTKIGWIGQTVINAFIELGSYLVNTRINGDNPTLGGLMSSFIFGGAAGALGGAGTMKGDCVAKTFAAFKRKNYFATIGKNFNKDMVKSLLKEAGNAVIIGGILDGAYSKHLSEQNLDGIFIGW